MIRYIYHLSLLLACIGFCGIADASDVSYPFDFELRIHTDANPHLKTQISLVSRSGEDGTPLSACTNREDGGFTIYQGTLTISSEDKPQRGLIVTPFPADVTVRPTAQVFRLSIPRTPKPKDWSQWQSPSYLEPGDAGWTFPLPDSKVTGRSTNLPPVYFEVRYKIESKKIE
jgi:hypothetical protein